LYDAPLELEDPMPELEPEPMFGQFEFDGFGAERGVEFGVVLGVVLGVVVVELPLAAHAPPPAASAAAATVGATKRIRTIR